MSNRTSSRSIEIFRRQNRLVAIGALILLTIIYLLIRDATAPDAVLETIRSTATDIMPDILAGLLVYIFGTLLYTELLEELQRLDSENDVTLARQIEQLETTIDRRTVALDRRFDRLEDSLRATIPHLETAADDNPAPLSEPLRELLHQLLQPATITHLSQQDIQTRLMQLTRQGLLNQNDYRLLLEHLNHLEQQAMQTPGQSEGRAK